MSVTALLALSLLQASATAVPATPAAPAPAPKMRCKRESVIGSLAEQRKVCHTEAEWQAIYRGGRATTADFQRPGVSPPTAN